MDSQRARLKRRALDMLTRHLRRKTARMRPAPRQPSFSTITGITDNGRIVATIPNHSHRRDNDQ